MRREWIKRTAVLTVLILCATLARMISDGAGVTVDPWTVLRKVWMIAGLTSTVYFFAFYLSDVMMGDARLPGVGKSALVLGAFIITAPLAAILGGFGQ